MEAVNLGSWLLVWATTLVINVIPAFMPPTWSVLVYFHLRRGLAVWPLALVGAAGAVCGRALLALVTRALGPRIVPKKWQANINALTSVLRGRKTLRFSSLAFFAVSPMPSNHLFIAAGLADVPLGPILGAFFVGRLVSYVLWVDVADTAAKSLRDVVGPSAGGWVGAAMQIGGFLILLAVMKIDWGKLLARWTPDPKTAALG